MSNRSRSAFTLVELLIAIAVVAILATVAVITINPAQLLAQGRDSNRLSDMSSLSVALSDYQSIVRGSMGTANTIYVSLPDSSPTCGSWNLPTAPSGTVYQCAPSSAYRKTDGTGWIPVNFSSITPLSPISTLPVDPTNTSSTDLYYTYTTDGSNGYKVTAFLESQKDGPLMGTDGGNDAGLYEEGTNLALASGRGLVGYWPMDEGVGTTAFDKSGNGNNGTLSSPAPTWISGKVGSGALSFNGSTNLVSIPDQSSLEPSGPFTVAAWVKATAPFTSYAGFVTKYGFCTGGTCGFDLGSYSTHKATFNIRSAANGNSANAWTPGVVDDGSWHFVVGVFTGSQVIAYSDGNAGTPVSWTYPSASSTAAVNIGARGGSSFFNGSIDDARIYNRALSATEIQALYNAEK